MVQLIDKSALVAEIERKRDICKNVFWELIKENKDYYQGKAEAYKDTLDLLGTLEVKDVDLEDELNKWRHEHFHGRRDKDASGEYFKRTTQLDIAKHFFELGMRSNITEEDCKLIWNIGDEIPNMPEEKFFKELLKRFKAQKGEKL